MLFTKEDKGLLLNFVQILGSDYIDKLDDFTVQGEKTFILCMKHNRATGCDVTSWGMENIGY